MDHLTTHQLLAAGWTRYRIGAAVRRGELVRVRQGHFIRSPLTKHERQIVRALRLGGRLACVSELRRREIWVLDDARLHVAVAVNASRLRNPDDSAIHIVDAAGTRLHWHPFPVPHHRAELHSTTLEALADASRCLERRAWIASVDSALHLRRISGSELTRLRTLVSRASRRALSFVDSRAGSGLETIVRMIALDLGFRVRSQVWFDGIGRVDLVIEDWIVVETDGSEFHDAALSPRDRRRDAGLAARGRTVLRPGYSLIVFDQQAVANQLIGALASHRRVRDSGRIVARARARARQLGFS